MKKIYFIICFGLIILASCTAIVQSTNQSIPAQINEPIGDRQALPAARLGDQHQCLVWIYPPGVWIPSIGQIVGPGCPTVLINGQIAARLTDMCDAPPDPPIYAINSASATVFIGGLSAARMGDTTTANQGVIITGSSNVNIG